jgi:2-polyprenyl-3-methyl-5-hydroxy-6-metoxy-1,4-benzoquinol methylase
MADLRFKFGANWQAFLSTVDEARIRKAEERIQDLLGVSSLAGRSFLDVGSGSGLMSLAARRLGATVYSFDYDEQSVACTSELRRRYFPEDPNWTVERGDALDANYIAGLGQHDIAYSWGVLHHTGDMWAGLQNICQAVKPGGQLYIALYNDQGNTSRRWLYIKRLYNKLSPPLRVPLLWATTIRLWSPTVLRDLIRYGDPSYSWRRYYKDRGMSAWHDVVDWVGGYPFEVSKPEEIYYFYRSRGFEMERLFTVQGLGCNEFVFRRKA